MLAGAFSCRHLNAHRSDEYIVPEASDGDVADTACPARILLVEQQVSLPLFKDRNRHTSDFHVAPSRFTEVSRLTKETDMELRFAEEAEIGQLAKIWYEGWQEAHARILPTELAKYRTLESFIERLRSALPKTRVAGPSGKPLGFSVIKNDELYQLYVSAGARGTGVASALLADAEARLTADG